MMIVSDNFEWSQRKSVIYNNRSVIDDCRVLLNIIQATWAFTNTYTTYLNIMDF
jgi:hypothetical protein